MHQRSQHVDAKQMSKNLLSPAEEEIFLFDFLFTLNTIRISAIYFWTFAD